MHILITGASGLIGKPLIHALEQRDYRISTLSTRKRSAPVSTKIKTYHWSPRQGIFDEKDLLNLYKKFQFEIDDLINYEDSLKSLPDYEGRALMYQRFLLTDNLENICHKTIWRYEMMHAQVLN